MNIKEFVSQVLIELSQGLHEAQIAGVEINPTLGKSKGPTRIHFALNVETESIGSMSLKVVNGAVNKSFSNRIEFFVDACLLEPPSKKNAPKIPKYYESKDTETEAK